MYFIRQLTPIVIMSISHIMAKSMPAIIRLC